MIIRFKIFEKWLNGKYWLIKIDDDLLKYRLKKIGMNIKEIFYWCDKKSGSLVYMYNRGDKYIYIGYDGEKWTYTPENYEEDFINPNPEKDELKNYYIFQGVVDKLSTKEINKYKKQIELEKNADKFNL